MRTCCVGYVLPPRLAAEQSSLFPNTLGCGAVPMKLRIMNAVIVVANWRINFHETGSK